MKNRILFLRSQFFSSFAELAFLFLVSITVFTNSGSAFKTGISISMTYGGGLFWFLAISYLKARFSIKAILAWCDLIACIHAAEKGQVIPINHFVAHYLTEQKLILGFLHDSEFRTFFTDDGKNIINTIVPFTVNIRNATLADINEPKENWVLKKSLDTRRRGVYIGSECMLEQSKNLMKSSKESSGNFVLQKRVQNQQIGDLKK